MKTPLLNPEIYNKVNDSATSRDKITRDIKGKLQDVSPLLYKSLRLNNTMFTEIQRNKKVKFANLQEKNFKHYAKSDSSEDYLFDEKTMKRMNQDLKTIQDRYRSRNLYQPSKNWGGSYKAQRSRSHSGKSNQYYNQRKKY